MMPRKIVLLLVGISLALLPVMAVAAKKDPKAKEPPPKIGKLISPSQTNWVQGELQDGRSVVITNSYLFQVMKGAAQENQKRIEENLLIPALEQMLRSLVAASKDPNVSRLFGVPLAILADDPKVGLSPDTLGQAKDIQQDHVFAPRGHYNDSEALGKYFRAMQYLSKVTMDAGIRLDAFPFPAFMLFDFDTAVKAIDLLSQPANAKILDQWKAIHTFYADVNGTADSPTFLDLMEMPRDQPLTKERVKEWAVAHELPTLNPERGLGIQPFGERFSLHQEVIDEVKRKFMKDDTPREEISDLLKFRSLAAGLDRNGEKAEGLAERIKQSKPDNYYSTAIQAIALGAEGWKHDKLALNFFAASLTSLAEQTALMAKTAILVRKSAEPEKSIPQGAKLLLRKDSEKYITALGAASASLLRACKEMQSKFPAEPQASIQLVDPGPLFKALAAMSKKSRFEIYAQTLLSQPFGDLVAKLTRKPLATVDVFQVKERSGKIYYYQWAVAPFEAVFTVPRMKAPPKGLEMVFFEGWADDIVTDHEGPLNNLVWEGRVQEGDLKKLKTILTLPDDAPKPKE